MRNMIVRFVRLILSVMGFGLVDREDQVDNSRQAVDSMRKRLADLRASTAAIIANEFRMEKLLREELEALAQAGSDDLRNRVDSAQVQLEAARCEAAQAKHQLEVFREELRQAAERVRDAQVSYQLATLRAEAEKLAMDARFDRDLIEIRRVEDRARSAKAEAEALAELNAAIIPDEAQDATKPDLPGGARDEQA